ncbi:MAG: hypothetical protein HYS12_06480 [Planctomycetes bacterium]|nr:hypothetical protein [Planctomycetota bacterium]
MRPYLLALVGGVLLAGAGRGGEVRFFEDAALHAVQFVSAQEGWAVGDEGVIWHTIDGGKTWDRQPTGVRASLRSVHFVNAFVGWVAGREELPLGAGSTGVLLLTRDGGERWQRVSMNLTPGLHYVHFVDAKTGYALGDATDQFPSGVFVTKDGGQVWRAVAGPRCPGWNAGAFTDADHGALVGSWNRLANIHNDGVTLTNVESLGGRNIHGVYLPQGRARRGVAVGQGGLILLTDNAGAKWSYPELLLPFEVLSSWDFRAVHGAGVHVWAAGRPGSVLLHSGDGGQTWDMQSTGQPLPIDGLFFHDERTGWAVGELGTILATTDGGRTWKVQQQGGRRASLLFLHASSAGVPADTVARLSGDEGFLSTAVRVLGADSTTAAFARAAEGDRLSAAMRLVGGSAGELLWQFPLPPHLAGQKPEEIAKAWAALHGEKASEQLLRQLVLAIRVWRPDVVVTDQPDATEAVARISNPSAREPRTDWKSVPQPADTLVAGAVREAFGKAADPKAFPEQLNQLGLQAWKPSKLYALSGDERQAQQVALDLTEVRPRLGGSVRDFASLAAGLLTEGPPALPRRRTFRLMASHLDGAEHHRGLMEGIPLCAVGDARRNPALAEEITPETLHQIRLRANLQAMIQAPVKGLTDPNRLLASVGPMLSELPDGQGAAAVHALASHFARQGQWFLAREAYLQMVGRYPAHPLTADAYRWLIRHNSSSETRRRHELGQFVVTQEMAFLPPGTLDGKRPTPAKKGLDGEPLDAMVESLRANAVEFAAGASLALVRRPSEIKRWHQGSLELEPKLAAFGPLLADDPAIQFCLHAARRNLGDFETPRKWFADFVAHQPAGPWRDAAAAELWLTNPQGTCPKPVAVCQQAETRPFLDGQFDDACWQGLDPLVLLDAGVKGDKQEQKKNPSALLREYPTKVWLTYDQDFLYLALRCEHPPERYVAPVKGRKRDADLDKYDRVSLLLDLDRDYATCFHFEVDQRGCVREDCWGDTSWDPRWFVAVHSEPTAWQIEAAIPLSALTGDTITSGRTWACNLIRVVPGQGVQGWSLPAGVPGKDARPEGMGLLSFRLDPRQEARARPRPTGPRMSPAP